MTLIVCMLWAAVFLGLFQYYVPERLGICTAGL